MFPLPDLHKPFIALSSGINYLPNHLSHSSEFSGENVLQHYVHDCNVPNDQLENKYIIYTCYTDKTK